jgi:transposase
MMKKELHSQEYWVGVDWGSEHHAVSIVDTQRKLVNHFLAPATLEGLEQLGKALAALKNVGGVAIETTHMPIFYFLVEKGYTVYPVNPKLSKQWREGMSVAGNKSDERDGQVLALELARRHEELRPFCQRDPATEELVGLCKKQRALIDQRTALVQQLREALNAYYPAALGFFSDLTAPTAWAFCRRFANPQSLAGSRKETLFRFLRAHRIGLKPVWIERVESRGKALDWPTAPDARAQEIVMRACVAQLQALQGCLDQLEKIIEACAAPLPETKILRSLPGVGERLGPALAAMVRAVQAESEGIDGLRCLSGVAPVENSSGKRRQTKIRRRCNKSWRTTLHLFASCSIAHCSWAKAFYDLCKERGDKHGTALRKLADKWLRIIHCMLQSGQPYEEKRYLQALRQNGSPVYLRLSAQNGG